MEVLLPRREESQAAESKSRPSPVSPLQATILRVLQGFDNGVPRTKLVKLLYLIDYIYFQHVGRTLTGLQYKWDRFGPNAKNFEIVDDARELVRQHCVRLTEEDNPYGGVTLRYTVELSGKSAVRLDALAERIVSGVVSRYHDASIKRITADAKRTPPFLNAQRGAVLDFDRPDAFYRG